MESLGVDVKARYRVRLYDLATEQFTVDEELCNLITNVGLTDLLNRWTGAAAVPALGWLAVGTGNGAPAYGDVALFTELSRVDVVWSVSGSNATGSAFFSAEKANGTLTELGLFSQSVGGQARSHGKFINSIVKTSASWLQVDVTLSAGRA